MKVLIAALNWGLGHSTRDVPVIVALLERGHEVHLASDGDALKIFQSEFPQLPCYELPSYDIRYQKGGSFALRMLVQAPKVAMVIQQEKLAIKELMKQHSFDFIISDNRFGVQHPLAKNIFITHQYFLEAPILKGLLNRKNQRMIQQYDHLLIPDFEGTLNLSGTLTHLENISMSHFFMGPLSRFENQKDSLTIPLLALVSGPEPQRTLLEEEVLRQLKSLPVKSILLRGCPGESGAATQDGNVTIYNHLPGADLQSLLQKAEWVIARTGYTTVMDLVMLRKKAVLIPTPKQSEQELLGAQFRNNKWFVVQQQGSINLSQLTFDGTENVLLPDMSNGKLLNSALQKIGL